MYRTDTTTRLGPLHRLVSSSGTILGTVSLPADLAEAVAMNRVVFLLSRPAFSAREWLEPPEPALRFSPPARLFQTWTRDGQPALRLDDMSLEDFEKMPGCSFQPSAAYLRSLIE